MINLFFLFFLFLKMAFQHKLNDHFTNNWAPKQLEIFQKNKWSKGDHGKQEIYGCNFEPKWTCRAIYKITSEMWKLMWVPLIWINRVWRTLIIAGKPQCQCALVQIQASTIQALEMYKPGAKVHPAGRLVNNFEANTLIEDVSEVFLLTFFSWKCFYPLEVWKFSCNVGVLFGKKKREVDYIFTLHPVKSICCNM